MGQPYPKSELTTKPTRVKVKICNRSRSYLGPRASVLTQPIAIPYEKKDGGCGREVLGIWDGSMVEFQLSNRPMKYRPVNSVASMTDLQVGIKSGRIHALWRDRPGPDLYPNQTKCPARRTQIGP